VLDMQANSITQAMRRMVKDGQISTSGDGQYYSPESDLSQVSPTAEPEPVQAASEPDENSKPPRKLKIVPSRSSTTSAADTDSAPE
jgi:hypothetical protein